MPRIFVLLFILLGQLKYVSVVSVSSPPPGFIAGAVRVVGELLNPRGKSSHKTS